MKAFVLISLSDRSERNVVSELKTCPEIKNAYILFGEWDIMAEVDVSSPEQLGTFVLNNIRSRNDVRLTSSMIVAAR
ncbi:MAG: Lrp/AsnC ligand binding domain-containing protein [Nanoarchaeota archaeon]